MRKRIKPAQPNAVIRDPISKMALPAEGKEIKMTSYWHRRLIRGEVVEVSTPAPKKVVRKTIPKKHIMLPSMENKEE